MTDPIADMLTRIRNAYSAGKESVEVPHSKLKEAIAKVLDQEGYIDSFKVKPDKPRSIININLKYKSGEPAISSIRRISKPGLRVYTNAKKIKSVLSGHGISIISTSKGVVSDKQARNQNLGGEVLCKVW